MFDFLLSSNLTQKAENTTCRYQLTCDMEQRRRREMDLRNRPRTGADRKPSSSESRDVQPASDSSIPRRQLPTSTQEERQLRIKFCSFISTKSEEYLWRSTLSVLDQGESNILLDCPEYIDMDAFTRDLYFDRLI